MGKYYDKHGYTFGHQLLKYFAPTAPFARLGGYMKDIDRIGDELLQGLEDTDMSSALPSLVAKYTGSELTGAEREANAFSAEQAELARQHDIYMSMNKYQMETQSMQNAGLNPAMVYGGGNLVPTHANGAAPSSVSPSNGDLGSFLMNILRLPAEVANMKAQAHKNEAEAENLRETTLRTAEETRGQKLSNDWLEQTFEDRKESIKLANDLSRADKARIYALRDQALSEASLNKVKESTEITQQGLNQATSTLRYMEAYDIQVMQSYKIALTQAQTSAERAYASLLGFQEAIQRGIYTEDYIEGIHQSLNNSNVSTEAKGKVNKVIAKLRTGEAITPLEFGDSDVANFFEGLVNGVVTESINNGVAAVANLLMVMPDVATTAVGVGLNTPQSNKIGY